MIKVKGFYGGEKLVLSADIAAQTLVYESIMKQAEKAGLIAQAGGGVCILMHPETQIEKDVYHRIQIANDGLHRCKEANKKVSL